MKKKLLYAFLILFVLGISAVAYIWFFVWNKKHKDIERAKVDYVTTASALMDECESDTEAADSKYNEKVVQFTGKVYDILPSDSISEIIFDEGKMVTIHVQSHPKHNDLARNLEVGSEVTIKALYVGCDYDPIMAAFDEPGSIRFKKGFLIKK